MIAPRVELFTAPVFRRSIRPVVGHGELREAVLHISGLGVVEAYLDEQPVTAEVLTPGWSAYEWRLRYRSWDVTGLISLSGAVLTVVVGNGWYRGRLGFTGLRELYGSELGVIAQLELTFADGHVQTICSDKSWSVHAGDVLSNDLYDGQVIDARLREVTPDAHPTATGVRVLEFDTSRLTPYLGPPVVRHESVRPVESWSSPSGRQLVDFGQNLVGWLRIRVQGPRGAEIRVRHAEVLEDDELGVRPLRRAQATDRFILSGGPDIFEPTFTAHGFRYVEVSGWPGPLSLDDIEAVVVHSELRRIGTFACSDDLLNQLHSNVVWSARGNALDLPTDCPQRDERMGWTGDLAVFAPSAAYLFDVSGFLSDWLLDLAAEQEHADGRVPPVVPDIFKLMPTPPDDMHGEATAIWSDAAVWVPWALYEAYGDLGVLERQYDSMLAHLRRVEGLLSEEGLWDQGFQYGDWLDPDAPPDQPAAGKADPAVVATACLYRSVTMARETAKALGCTGDRERLDQMALRLRAAFNAHYVGADGTVRSDCTTVYTLAISFGLLDAAQQRFAGDRLAHLVAEAGYLVSTGFAGTPFICDALARTGHLDDAYALLTQTECPSWLYPVTMGATTIWERWDSMLPDGRVNPGDMTSFNHYALGAVAQWLHTTVAGIAPLSPGYATVLVAPRPGGGLTWAAASLASPHGEISVRWDLTDAELVIETQLPRGVTGILSAPDGRQTELPTGTTRTRLRR